MVCRYSEVYYIKLCKTQRYRSYTSTEFQEFTCCKQNLTLNKFFSFVKNTKQNITIITLIEDKKEYLKQQIMKLKKRKTKYQTLRIK